MVLTETKTDYLGFDRGLAQVKVGDYRACIADLYAALGIRNRNSFIAYRYGKIEPKASKAEAVTAVFAKYGVTKDIWGVCG